jgi:hypothetical protein
VSEQPYRTRAGEGSISPPSRRRLEGVALYPSVPVSLAASAPAAPPSLTAEHDCAAALSAPSGRLASALRALQPRPAADRSRPHTPLTEQQPVSIIPMTASDGHAGSGVPTAVFTQVLAAPDASVNIPRDDPKVAPHPLSGKQHGDSGTNPLLGTVHVVPPHVTDIAAPEVASPLTSVIGNSPESLEPPESATSPTVAGAWLELLHAAPVAHAAITRQALGRTRFM